MPPPMGRPGKGPGGPIEKAKDFKGTTKKLILLLMLLYILKGHLLSISLLYF